MQYEIIHDLTGCTLKQITREIKGNFEAYAISTIKSKTIKHQIKGNIMSYFEI